MGVQRERSLDLNELINSRPFSGYQWLILILCFLIVAIDGFDTASVGFIAPALVETWGISRPALAPVLSAALVGLAIGALTAGPLADRFGRKVVLVTAVVLFGSLSLASAFADNIAALTALRFLTGLGLGAAMPNATTLVSEYCPERRRSLFVTMMFCGFTLGSALGGFVAAGLIPHFGWQSVFVVGGVMPLALAVVLVLVLPESARFLIVKQRPMAQIQAVVRRIAPGADVGVTRFTVPEEGLNKPKSSLHGIFTPQLAAGTLMLWSTYFFGLVVIYLLTSWLPTLMGQVGFSISTAAWVTACFQLGGTAGALLVGWAMDHFRRPHTVLALTYVLAALFIFIVGRASGNAALLAVAVLAGGFFMSGAQTPLAALSAAFYPTQVRATGISWMMGIGRFGSILGAGIGGQLLPLGFEAIFALLAIPALIAAFAVAMKGRIYANLANAPVQVAPVRDTSAA